MDLIIKPTQACNFGCTFCSSNRITEGCATLPLKKLFTFLEENDVRRIIVNGGDPLMMPPEYYWAIIRFLDEKDMPTTLSLTSNLWDFYLHPDKWVELFKHPRVGVCTSFQYGEERRLRDGRVFTEELFRKVFQKFYEKVGYKLMFISVTTEANEDRVMDTVRLAKELGTQCKINPAVKSGRAGAYYPFHKMCEKYLEIIDAGLKDYEANACELFKVYHHEKSCCPYCRTCYRTIRAMSPDGLVHSCGSFNDDHFVRKEAGLPTYCLQDTPEDKIKKDFRYLKPECLGCDLNNFCNSCFKRSVDILEAGQVEEHCKGMKKLKARIERTFKR